MRRVGVFILAPASVVWLGAMAATAAADVLHVHHGQSIQAAVDRADPGDTVKVDRGRYLQNVTILRPGVTLRGAGGGVHGTVLVQAKTPVPSPCTDPSTG